MKIIKKFKKNLVNYKDNLKKIIQVIDSSSEGFCFVEKNNSIVGVVSDGDLRRSMLKNLNYKTSAKKIMNKNYIWRTPIASKVEIRDLVLKLNFLPILNSKKNLLYYYSLGKTKNTPVQKPYLHGNEIRYLKECIETNWISSQGKFINKFEKKFSEIFKLPNPLTTSSGTTALHLALLALDIKKGDEVLVPNLTFAATINSILYCGATPVIIDVNKDDFSIDIDLLKKSITPKTKAILVVHLYGFITNMSLLKKIAYLNKLYLIEDCAEAVGSYHNKAHVGSFGDASTFSFFGNKTITTGEGGMVCFKNKKNYKIAKVLRDHGMSPKKRYWHERIGYNYRMTNIQAAIGLSQLENIKKIISKKTEIVRTYEKTLFLNNNFYIPQTKKGFKNAFWFFLIILTKKNQRFKKKLISFLQKKNIETRPTFYPLNKMKIYKKYSKGKYPVSEFFFKSIICLPSWTKISFQEIKKISKQINIFFKKSI